MRRRAFAALLVASYRRYANPVTLRELQSGTAVPQSFVYLPKDIVTGPLGAAVPRSRM